MPVTSDARALGARWFAETIDALGGEAFLNLKAIQWRGTGSFTTPPPMGKLTVPLHSLTYTLAEGGRMRMEAVSFGGRLIFASRGAGKGGFAVLAGRTLTLGSRHVDHVEPTELLRAAALEKTSVIARPDDVSQRAADGAPLRRYDIERESGIVTRVFAEERTGLVRTLVTQTARGEMTVQLSRYAPVDDLALYHELRLLEDGNHIITLNLTSPILDPVLGERLFQEP